MKKSVGFLTAAAAAVAMASGAQAGTLEDVAHAITSEKGMRPIRQSEAGRGDLALLESQLGDVLGVHCGGVIYAAAPAGLARAPVHHARLHWAV